MIRQHTLASLGLSHAEVTLIQTIIRLSSEQAVGYWDWVMDIDSAIRLDGLLVSAQYQVDEVTLAKAKHVLFIGEPATALDRKYQVISRPIRAETLIKWMVENTEGLEALPAKNSNASPTPPSQTPAVVTQSAANKPVPGTTTEPGINFSRTAAKLTRWPNELLLRKDSGRIRMATLLAKRPLTAGTLAVMAGQSIIAADQFLHDLLTAGMLQLQPATSVSASADAPMPDAVNSTTVVHTTHQPQSATPASHSQATQQLDASLLDKLLKARAQASQQTRHSTTTAPRHSTGSSAPRSFFQGLRRRFGL